MHNWSLRHFVPACAFAVLLLSLCLAAGADPPLPPGHPRLQITSGHPAPVIVRIGAVDHDILALQIEAQRTRRSAVIPYEALPGDEIRVHRQHDIVRSVELIRGGAPVAYLAGEDHKHAWFFEKLIGTALDTEKADDPATYALAALEFYRLTGNRKWHERFIENSMLARSQSDVAKTKSGKVQGHGQRDAAFLYARLPGELATPRIAAVARSVLMKDAARCLDFARENAWGFVSSDRYRATGTGWFSTPELIPLMRACYLSGKPEYHAAMIRGVLFSVGANPMNLTYTTGVGHAWPRNAMVLDSRRTARAVPDGITVFGQVDYRDARARNNK